ncbi:predicted protein [Verticillium alfalfae VaMs.102]|uniref:Predicted protein n=1 Tax=Verticillium alfalfae (strain VaMs.102 / ATCC MYA-4576 / FGSC 10136) TaxID=526221 RepID=C9SHG8_VERA1|nr:predicted protein [Verticillium alfalfae VaMs.102]EEY18391.1 predicted protein [Verticillium alfalfae VaMs.102]
MTPLDTLSRDLDTSAPLTTSPNEPIEEVTAPIPEEEFPTTTKKSKKDKKKKKDLVEESVPEPPPVSEEPTVMDEAVPTHLPPEDDSFFASTSKKDKKKKKGLLAAAALVVAAASSVEASPPSNDDESSRQAPAEVPDNSQATTDVPPAVEEVSTPVFDEAQPTDTLPESLDQTAVADDEFPVVSKKSKKDKKKKGKSEPEADLEPEVQAEPEPTQPATLSWADDIPAEPPQEPEAQPEPSAVEPEEEPAPVVGKKSKKDKKKKGKGNASSEPASEVATPVEDLSPSLELPPVTEDPAPAEAAPVVLADAAPTDEWAEATSTKKKSKKDKKKKKGLLSDDLETPSPDSLAAPTETVAEPAVDLPTVTDDLVTSEPAAIETPATETLVAETPVVDEREEQISVSEKSKKSKKNKLQDDSALESGAATPVEEVSQDTKALDLATTDDIPPEPTPVEIQEEHTLTPDNSAPAPEEPAADDEWGAAPTKKSKKDKKKKRASQIEPEPPLSADRVEDQELQQSPQVRDSSQESPLDTAGASPPVEEVLPVPDVAAETSVAPVENAVVETAAAPGAADEWADLSTSKKGKKKNKKGKGVIEPEPELEVIAEPASEPVVAPASEPLVETVPQVADLTDSVVPLVDPATPVDPAAEAVVEPVDEWAQPATSKKSKKNKKKGKAVTEPEPELTSETIAEPVHEPAVEPTIDLVTAPIDLITSDVLPAQDAAPVASEQPAIEPVDEWAEPATTKKNKKNKKKGKGVVEVEPEPEPVLQSVTELATEPVAELATEPVTESVSESVGTIATDAPAATEEPVVEAFDEWAEAATSKNGKKNKKKAKGVVETEPKLEPEIIPEPVPEALSKPTPEPAVDSPAEPVDLVTADVPVPSEEPIAEPADEWAELTTSKKGKKNKKKGKSLTVESPLEPVVEPLPEAAVEPVTAPVVVPEAVSEPAPEVQTAIETELVAPLDDSSRNLDTPPAESGSPAEDQSSAAVDDWADLSSSKKSKKNKKKTKATDEPAPAIAEELPRAQDEIREATMDAAADPIVTAEPTPLPEQEPVADEFADLGSKKSKKNKKKVKSLVSVEPEITVELQSEPAHDAVDSTAIESSSTLSDPATVLEDIPVIESSTPLDQDAIAAADEWADFGTKKNKKGKKSKGVTFDDAELPPTTDVTEPSRDIGSAEPGLPVDVNLAEATAIPEAEVEPVIEAEVPTTTNDEWADSGSKNSKKKKKKGKSVAFDEPETTVETASKPVVTQDELVLPSEPTPIETPTLPQEVEVSTEQASSAPVDEWNDFGSTKKSKKKKKGKGSVLDEFEPATSAPLEAPSEAAIDTQAVPDSVDPTVAEDVTAEPLAVIPAETEVSTPVDDWAASSTKKSKKGKKKAKGSAFDEPEPFLEPVVEATPDVIVEAPVEAEPVPAAEPEVANPVDEWAESSNKKSKKDKKKKRQSAAWDDPEPSTPASTESPAHQEEPVVVDAPRDLSIEAEHVTASSDLPGAQTKEVQEALPASSEPRVEEVVDKTIEEVVSSQETPQSIEEPAEDPANVSSVKKSKKDKKKKRDSLAQFDDEPQPVQEDAVPTPQEEPVFDTAISEDPAVVPEVVEEPFADSFSSKKSKKDKKKAKRQSLLMDSEPATPAESPMAIEEAPTTYAETPIVEEQQADIAETPAAAEAEPSIVAEDVKPIDLELPAVVPGAVEDKVIDQPLEPVQAVDDDADWGVFTAPSKKSKKGKKGKASADTSEPVSRALSPSRELDSAALSSVIEGPEAVPEVVPEISEPAFEEPAPQPEPVIDDEWALPTKKKKGKKGKAAAVLDVDSRETSLPVESPALEEVLSTAPEVVDITEATEKAPVPVEPVLAEPSGEPEPVAEDEWALPSSKKKKKGKKAHRSGCH